MDWLLLALGLVLCAGTGLFVAAEFALVNLDRNDLESRQEQGERRLGPVIAALKHTSTQLSSAQLGITITTLLTGFTMEPAISNLLRDLLLGVGVPESWVRGVGVTVAMTLATLLSMLLGELIPKNFALALPKATAKAVVPLTSAFLTVVRPFVRVLNGSANAIIRSLGIEPKEELSGARTAEELSSLVRRSALVGLLDSDRAILLSRTLRFSEHIAADVMTPRPRLNVIEVDATVSDLVDLARQTGHSRFPVIGDDIDDIVGVAHLKSAVAVPRDRRDAVPVGAIKEDALLVPETLSLDQLLGELRAEGYQLAIVLDEYGGTAGVATLEDLVEELVGDLADEHDQARADIIRRRDRILFDGLLRPDELRDRLNIDVDDDGPYETIGGFLMHALGRVPEVGDRVEIPVGDLIVAGMDGRRVDRIRFVPNAAYETREDRIRRERDHDREGKR